MSDSSFGWLDHDDNARRRMMEVVDLFREKGTLDELGIGSIRDTFADCFFPGTSTIQTRVRYFLFLPWIFTAIERDRVSGSQAADRARRDQHRLVESLKRGERTGEKGIIGREAGESLKRLPANIYWNGLGIWGIRLFSGTTSQYHGSLHTFYRTIGRSGTSDMGELADAQHHNWVELPVPPSALLESTNFQLTREEAQFLKDQIGRNCERSVLAHALQSSKTAVRQARNCWDLIDLPGLDPVMRHHLDDARRFASLMEGAVLLYNLMLAEALAERTKDVDSVLVERYRTSMARWADEVVGGELDLRAWSLDDFAHGVRTLNPRVPARSLDFCRTWMTAARAEPRSMGDDPAMRTLLAHRERQLKGGLARLTNARALESWSGESGLGRLDYRWGTARPMILDIFEGLQREAGAT